MASIVIVVSDLMFASRIREAAKASGADVRSARSLDQLLETCRAERPALVIADLDDPRLGAIPAITALRADPVLRDLTVVGFISHVDGSGARAATEAGCTRVLARSAFVAELPRIVSGGGA